MSADVSTLSPAKLSNLSRGDTIPIRYKPSNNSNGLIIYPDFPKAIAVRFSSRWATEFPAQLNRKDMFHLHPKELIICGGGREQAEDILVWMKRCCNTSGFKYYRMYQRDDIPFTRYFDLHQSAQAIGCHYLVNEFDTRMSYLLERQVHSEDVRAMFKKAENNEIATNAEVLNTLANHIAMHIFNRTLRARAAYDTLRDEMNALNVKVVFYLTPMIAARKASNRAERQAVTDEQRSSQQTTLSCPIVPQPQGGRPGWAGLDLASIGVGPKFTPPFHFGGKTPARFRHKEGESKKENNQVDAITPVAVEEDEAVDGLATNMSKIDITNTNINNKGVGGRFVPGATGSDSNMSKKQRQRAKKRAEKEGKQEVDEKVVNWAEATAE